MPHVDEGTLHALLDGALRAEDAARAAEVQDHLAGCVDCRARLEAAAELRDDASRILDDAVPAAPDLPEATADSAGFQEVVARAGGSRDGRTRRRAAVRRQLGWTRGVAWAATLVIALGTGYLLRDMVGPDRSPPAAQLTDSAARQAAPADSPARQEAPAAPEAAGSAVADGAAAEADDGAAEADRSSVEPEPGPAVDGMATEQRATLQQEAVGLDGQEAIGSVGQEMATDRPAAASPATDTAARWVAGTVAEGRAALDGPLYVLPRAALLEVYLAENAPAAAVLTLQRLESGVSVRVVQRRLSGDNGATGLADAVRAGPSGDPAVDPIAGLFAGRPGPDMPESDTVQVILDPYILVIEGTLPEELLSILGEAARPAP